MMADEIYKYGSAALLLALIGTWTYVGVAGKQSNYYCEEKPTYWQQYRIDLIEGAEIFMSRFERKDMK